MERINKRNRLLYTIPFYILRICDFFGVKYCKLTIDIIVGYSIVIYITYQYLQMRFSVLLSVYYKESYISFCKSLDSIFTQTICPDEVILVEDGPLGCELDDIVAEYSSKYPVLKVIPLLTNQGLGKALNEGLKHCSYDIVARMDTDDVAKPDRFEKQLAILEKYSNIDVVGTWIDEFENDISEIKSVRKLPELHDDIRQFAKRRNPMNHPVVMFRKSAVLAVGGYQHFPLFEDYYLWIRMLMNGAKFYNIQESLLFFRFSPEMFKRRGGWKYAVNEFRFLRMMRNMHFISFVEFMQNIFVRFSTRIIPNSLRSFIYKKILR